MEHLSGVKGVLNSIEIESTLTPMEIETAITAAFARNGLLAARKIQVETSGHKVKLRGNVKNFTAGTSIAALVEEIIPEAHQTQDTNWSALTFIGSFALSILFANYLG